MYEFFSKFSISDWIQLIGIITSLLASVVAIGISLKTLKQNNKMIEESTRPNIVIYSTLADSITYIIIKNYGSSSAVIDNIQCDYNFSSNETGDPEGNIFNLVNGAVLAPNQSIRCPLVGWELKKYTFNFEIDYHSTTHNYSEKITLKLKANNPFPSMNSSKTNELDALQNIYITLLEIMKRKL